MKLAIQILAGGAVLAVIIILLLHYYLIIDLPFHWSDPEPLTRDILDQSLHLGTQFLLNNQKPEGNFNYLYNWIKREQIAGDREVRQAGTAWSMALIYQDQPDPEVGAAVEKAIDFFGRRSKLTADGGSYIDYSGRSSGSLGTVALSALTCIDYLRSAGSSLSAEKLERYENLLDGYIKFLISAQTEDNLWHRSYNNYNGEHFGSPTPYSDGESLLALVKSARYMGREDLRPLIIKAADAGYRHNVQEALKEDPDSDTTKGYYQWGSMAFYELATSGWPDTEKYGDYVLELADWMIDVHKTLKRRRNTGYAYEGIIHAYDLAARRQEKERAEKYARVIEIGLRKLTGWQVGSPVANRFIRRHPTDDPLAIGGVQGHRREPLLRIDTTQHQMHAVILARRFVYK